MLHWRSRGFKTKLLAFPVIICMLYTLWVATEDNYGMESELIVGRHKGVSSPDEEEQGVRICSQKERIDHVNSMCKNLTNKYNDYSKSICFKAVNEEMAGQGPCLLVDHQHKVAFCGITKSGSSSGIALMMNYGPHANQAPVTYKKGEVHSPELKTKMGLVQEIYSSKLENYTKFMIVRHPFDRLLSSYLDKMHTVDTTGRFKSLRLEISIRYGDLKWKDLEGAISELPDVNVTFKQFTDMLTDPQRLPNLNDEHWAPSALLCDPCRVHYDYIMRTESLHHDATELIQNAYHQDNLVVPQQNVNRDLAQPSQGKVNNKVLNQYYDSVKKRNLNVLLKNFKTDLELYGYSFNTKTYEAKCNIDGPNGMCC